MHRLFALLLIFFWSSKMSSQENDNLIDSAAYSIDLDEYIITGQYSPTHYKNVVHNVEVIDAASIKRRGAVNLESAISISPAVRINSDPVLGSSITMRGIDAANVAILIDGVPVIGRLNGSIDLSQISMQNVSRIEIVKGPLSNIYGSNAAGGVINIITKKSSLDVFDLNLESQFESIGITNHNLGLGYKHKKLSFFTYGRLFKYDQHPVDSLRLIENGIQKFPFNPKEQQSYGAYVRYDINEKSNLLLKYDGNEELVYDFGFVRRPQFKPYANDREVGTLRNDFTALYKSQYGDLFLDFTTAFNSFRRFSSERRYYLEEDVFDPSIGQLDTNIFTNLFSRLNAAYTFNENISLVGGLTFNNETGSGDRIINRDGPDSLKASFQETAIYSELNIALMKNLTMLATGRLTIHSLYDSQFTPGLRILSKIGDKWTLKGGYAQGYRNPSLKELFIEFIDINHNIVGNPNLKPEVSNDFQATLEYSHNSKWEGSLNAYYTQIKNRISLTQLDVLAFRYDNISNYEVFGFQPLLSFKKGGLSISTAGNLGFWKTSLGENDTTVLGNVNDMNNTISYFLPKLDVNMVVNHRYVGSQPLYSFEENELVISSIEGYNMLDLSLGRSFWKDRISLLAGAKNVLNVMNTSVGNGGGIHSSGSRNIVSQGRALFVQIAFQL